MGSAGLGMVGGALGGLFGGLANLNAAKAAKAQFMGQSGAYMGQGNAAYGPALGVARGLAEHPPGYGVLGLAGMRTNALQAAGAQREAALERARLVGQRTGNLGAMPGLEAGIAEQASRAGSTALNDVAARNAQLKQEQQRLGLSTLGGIYGHAAAAGVGYADVGEKALEQELKARSQMWGGLGQGMQAIPGIYGAFNTGKWG